MSGSDYTLKFCCKNLINVIITGYKICIEEEHEEVEDEVEDNGARTPEAEELVEEDAHCSEVEEDTRHDSDEEAGLGTSTEMKRKLQISKFLFTCFLCSLQERVDIGNISLTKV